MNFTTRLVTLQPPGAALDGVLDALHDAHRRAGNSAISVGQASRTPKLPGQPDGGYAVVDLTTYASAVEVHNRFLDAARLTLAGCGVPYTWCSGDASWQSWNSGGTSWRHGPEHGQP
jgi:hypothetical protein